MQKGLDLISKMFSKISLSRDYPFKRDLLTPEKLVVWGHSLGTSVAVFEGNTIVYRLKVTVIRDSCIRTVYSKV